MLPAIGYAVKAPLKRGVEVAMRTSNDANPVEDILYNMHKATPKKHAGVLSYISTGVGMPLKHTLDFRKQLKVMI